MNVRLLMILVCVCVFGWTSAAIPEDRAHGLKQGHGMGFAKVAELNHYPGPRHVLDLADELALSPEQMAETESVFADMQQEAIHLGTLLVEQENALEALFATGRPSPDSVTEHVLQIGKTRALLRAVHLKAHLSMKDILSAEQVTEYDRLRGYGDKDASGTHH